MTKEEIGFAFTETITGDLDHPEVYARITKEAVKKLFAAEDLPTINEEGREDNDYIEGEVQFIFDADGVTLNEILIFPVYSDGECLLNGDFINAPDFFWGLEEEARKELEGVDKAYE